jgi:hypothetical protein
MVQVDAGAALAQAKDVLEREAMAERTRGHTPLLIPDIGLP